MQVVHIMSGVNQLLLSELFSSGRFEWLCRPNGPAADLQELRRLAFSYLIYFVSAATAGPVKLMVSTLIFKASPSRTRTNKKCPFTRRGLPFSI